MSQDSYDVSILNVRSNEDHRLLLRDYLSFFLNFHLCGDETWKKKVTVWGVFWCLCLIDLIVLLIVSHKYLYIILCTNNDLINFLNTYIYINKNYFANGFVLVLDNFTGAIDFCSSAKPKEERQFRVS